MSVVAKFPLNPVSLRCYSCGALFTRDPNLIDVVCPDCGSDSFTKVR